MHIAAVYFMGEVNMKRKALSLLLALSMVFTAVPTTVNAEEIGTYEVTEEADSQVDETEAESKETDVAETTESETAVEENSSEENISEEMQTTVEENTTVEDGSVEDTEASTEETLEALAENGQVSGQVSAKMFGSDGIEYEGVAYLSEANVLAMSEENQKAYQEMCDDIAQMKADNSDVRDIVISVDEEGVLGYSYFVPYHTVSDYQLEMAGINESEVEIISIDELADKLTEEATEETIVQETTEESTVEESTQEKTTEEESTVEESAEEETTEEETTVEETEAVVANAVNAVFAENVSLAQANAIEEEYIGDEFTKIESILPTNTYFKNQLDSVGTAVYNAGLSSMVNGGSNSMKVSLTSLNASSISDGLSALILTYPAKFDWTSKSGGWSSRGYYRNGRYDITITVVKSRHYNSSLESSAQKKVKDIKEKAFEYAKKNYPSNQTYGIVKYFDKWICENNYYNYPSLNMTDSNSIFFYCHSAYGALLKGYGVCESFALATSRLLDAAGIPNIYVVGDAGGGHAWNYVQMPDSKWYLLDTTWDNPSSSPSNASKGSTGEYLLVKNDGVHTPTGKGYNSGKIFKFPSLSTNNYSPASEGDFVITKTLLLEQGKSKQAAKVGDYYKHFSKKYSSSNTKVATIDKKGVVKAVGVGQATITVTVGAISSQMNVKVYKANALKFADNDKSSYKFEYGDTDGKFDSKDVFTKEIRLDVKQPEGSNIKASDFIKQGAASPTVKVSNKKVASVTASVSNNSIILKVSPLEMGSTNITVSFLGKKATLSLGVKQQIQSSWFSALEYTTKEYSGKEYKPKFTKTASAPAKLTYKTTYTNNKNAGTATVTIKGTGKFTGEIKKTFKITPVNITNAELKVKKASSVYNGGANPTKTTVKINKKTLKFNADAAKSDYIVYYNGATSATNKGIYTIKIVGRGNYTGTVKQTGTYEIKHTTINKVSVSCQSSVKYTGGNINPIKSVKIGKNVLAGSNYTVTYYMASDKELTNAVTPKNKGKYVAVVRPKGSNVVATDKYKYVKKSFTIK